MRPGRTEGLAERGLQLQHPNPTLSAKTGNGALRPASGFLCARQGFEGGAVLNDVPAARQSSDRPRRAVRAANRIPPSPPKPETGPCAPLPAFAYLLIYFPDRPQAGLGPYFRSWSKVGKDRAGGLLPPGGRGPKTSPLRPREPSSGFAAFEPPGGSHGRRGLQSDAP